MEMISGMIEVKKLYKVFGRRPKKVVPLLKAGKSKEEILEKKGNTVGVDNASFTVEEGEIFVIMGLSGSGKSTLLRCINRLIQPTSGEVIVAGTNLPELDKNSLLKFRREKFGMVFQNFALFPNRNVLENTEFGLEVQKVSEKKRRKKSREALEKVGLAGYEEKFPDQLSGGMQQRVGLARALAVDADILLMDEPFSALDPLIKKDMQNRLIDLHEELHKTIVFITHDLDEALKLGKRIAIMKDGRIVQIGNHEEILTQAESDYVRDFVEDVNRSRVLMAEDIMIKPIALLYPQDGPRTAIRKMESEGLESIFAVGDGRNLKGIVYLEDVVGYLKGDQDKEILDLVKEVPHAEPEENIHNLFAKIAKLNSPLPVIEDSGRLIGIIVKTTVLANLAAEQLEEI
jgi:glycine betaine/proline transport system ATP-binding protein